jgi:hypothetical protein
MSPDNQNPEPTFTRELEYVGRCPDGWMYQITDSYGGIAVPDSTEYAACILDPTAEHGSEL